MSDKRRGGPTPKVSDDEIRALLDKGLNGSQIAKHFTGLGRKITAAAIYLRIQKLRDASESEANRILPWSVRTEHGDGWVYKATVALAKREKGLGVTPRDLEMAKQLEKFLRDRDAVISYERESGFVLRNRRATDGDTPIVAA